MQKQIELTDKTVLVVGLPQGTTNYFKYSDNRLEWQLVGIHPELTEEECKRVVERLFFAEAKPHPYYVNYTDEAYYCDTPKEAFDTLMQKLECYTVNPYGNFECQNQWCEDGYIDQGYGDKWRCDFCQENEDKLDEAEQSTFKKFAILIKNNG